MSSTKNLNLKKKSYDDTAIVHILTSTFTVLVKIMLNVIHYPSIPWAKLSPTLNVYVDYVSRNRKFLLFIDFSRFSKTKCKIHRKMMMIDGV